MAILRPGSFVDANGRSIVFTADDLARIAENYDPAYHCAVVNIDHRQSGPAQGRIRSLTWDGRYLRAGISGVPVVLAQALSMGRYPGRSAEIYADLDGRGPYLRALALLGARPPAVKGLPPMPPPAAASAICQHPAAAACGLTALARLNTSPPHTYTIRTEVDMPELEDPSHSGLAETTADPALDETCPASAVNSVDQQETIRLAEENERLRADALRLAEENRAYKTEQHRRDVRFFMAELRTSGRLTPAMEHAGLEEALVAVAARPYTVHLADGRCVELGEVLRGLLAALPAGCPPGEAASAASAPGTPCRFSPDDEAVMAALGLSADEYGGGAH